MLVAILVSAFALLLGAGISAYTSSSISDAEIALQRETNAQNQENFETELEYNSVSNQLSQQRLSGVNPDLQDTQPTQSAGALPDLQSSDLSALAQSLSSTVMQASQSISNLVLQSYNVQQMQLDIDNSKTRNKLNNLLLGVGNYNFVVDDIANNVDPSFFENYGLSPDSSPDEFASLYDSTPDLRFISPDDFDGGVLNGSAVSSSMFDESHYMKLGFSKDEAKSLSALARSVSKSPDMQRRIYDRSADLYRSRRSFDFEDNNPFNRSSINDVPSAYLAYIENYATNVSLELENFVKQNQDISKMFGLTDQYNLDDLSVHANALSFQAQIDEIARLIELGVPSANAELMSSSINLQAISDQLDEVAKRASYMTIRNGMLSNNFWSRGLSLFQLNQLGSGQTFPLSAIGQLGQDAVVGGYSGLRFLQSLRDLGIISGDSKLLNIGNSVFNLDISSPEKWSDFTNLFK